MTDSTFIIQLIFLNVINVACAEFLCQINNFALKLYSRWGIFAYAIYTRHKVVVGWLITDRLGLIIASNCEFVNLYEKLLTFYREKK